MLIQNKLAENDVLTAHKNVQINSNNHNQMIGKKDFRPNRHLCSIWICLGDLVSDFEIESFALLITLRHSPHRHCHMLLLLYKIGVYELQFYRLHGTILINRVLNNELSGKLWAVAIYDMWYGNFFSAIDTNISMIFSFRELESRSLLLYWFSVTWWGRSLQTLRDKSTEKFILW